MPTLHERIAGGLWGLLVGDALGVPYEFHDPHDLPPRQALEMTPPAVFQRAHTGVPPATWSDDGAQALALLASLLEQGKLDLDDFGKRLVAWYEHGYLAVDNQVFDVGVQTSQAIRAMLAGVPAQRTRARRTAAATTHTAEQSDIMRLSCSFAIESQVNADDAQLALL